jgi:carbohydrate diacid regulator
VDVYNRAKKLHIQEEVKRVVFLVETLSQDETVEELLRSMFSSQNGDYITSVDEGSLILIKNLEEDDTTENCYAIARSIVDTVGAEAMVNVRIAFGNVVGDLKDVSKSYKEATMALEVGRIFYADKPVVSYESLGIGRLIYQLPIPLCRMFIREIFEGKNPDDFDEETLQTINKFFENSLNVSETSRQLFIHRNTLIYRIEKLQKATGLDVRVFDDALTLKIALMVVKYLNLFPEAPR